MSITSQITRLDNAKESIRDAIVEKGVTVPDNAKIDSFPDYIRMIEQGGTSSGGMDNDLKTWNQMNATLIDYLAASSVYTDTNYETVCVAPDFANSDADDPVGYDLRIEKAGTIYFEDETENQWSWHDTVSAGIYTVYDLIPEHIYRWYVIDSEGNAGQNGRLKATGSVRMIYDNEPESALFEAGDNIRDLGGWNCDGGTVKHGILYRGPIPRTGFFFDRICKR